MRLKQAVSLVLSLVLAGVPALSVLAVGTGYDDVSATAVDWARANGIISGKGGNRFDPRGNAARAEIATILAGNRSLAGE